MIEEKDLCQLYLVEKMTMKEIASELGVAVGTVFNYMKKYGINSRPTMTDETKAKISKAKKGKPSPTKGIRLSEETKRKISQAKKGKFLKPSEFGGHKKQRADGYICVYAPDHPYATKDGYVMEHILIMEKQIGRHITRDEVVHHKNKNRADNRIENLELMTFKEHAKYHLEQRRKAGEPNLR